MRKITKALVCAAALAAVAVGTTACEATDEPGTHASRQIAADQKAPADKDSKQEAPQYTTSQEQAISSANAYLDTMAFSRTGLIKQLSSKFGDGFSPADATFAVNHIEVNWNEQAAVAAADYLDTQAFSRQGLIDQLTSSYGDGYTQAQAVYGVNQTGL